MALAASVGLSVGRCFSRTRSGVSGILQVVPWFEFQRRAAWEAEECSPVFEPIAAADRHMITVN